VAFSFEIPGECIQDAHHGSEQSHEGGCRTDGGQSAQAALEFGVDNGFGALQRALGRLMVSPGMAAGTVLVGFELHQAGCDHFGQMALLVSLCHPLMASINAAIAESPGHCRSKGARLPCEPRYMPWRGQS